MQRKGTEKYPRARKLPMVNSDDDWYKNRFIQFQNPLFDIYQIKRLKFADNLYSVSFHQKVVNKIWLVYVLHLNLSLI